MGAGTGLYLRDAFPSLEDAVSGFGVALTRVIEGQNPDTGGPGGGFCNGSIGFAFKDVNGNVILPQLDSQGRILVNTEGSSGANLKGQGALANGVVSGYTLIPGTALVLTSGKSYADIGMVVACQRDAEFQLVQNNNGSNTVLMDVLLGPGQFTLQAHLDNLQATAGGAGTQQLFIQAVNLDKASALIATIVATQIN